MHKTYSKERTTAQSAANSDLSNMELYEKDSKKKEDNKVQVDGAIAVATALGAILGLATSAALEALIVWAILTALVGASVTWLQVFGVLLIVNGVTAKFRS